VSIPFVRDFAFEYGVADRVSPRIERVVARNPGPFTFTGTGTYLVGGGEPGRSVAVIDPGPDDAEHLVALLQALDGRTVSHILVTHTHLDHAPLAAPLAERTGAPVWGPLPPSAETHASGRTDAEDAAAFRPDRVLTGGERIAGEGWTRCSRPATPPITCASPLPRRTPCSAAIT
jgi:glyoxylase-like metal-dependent hydrolase (beta-lactamase superfamily II)